MRLLRNRLSDVYDTMSIKALGPESALAPDIVPSTEEDGDEDQSCARYRTSVLSIKRWPLTPPRKVVLEYLLTFQARPHRFLVYLVWYTFSHILTLMT